MDNVYRMLELIHYGRLHKQQSLDIEKAFDSLEHLYLLTLLDHMNFGPKMQTAIQSI